MLEATAKTRTRAELERHLSAGARRVISLAPPTDSVDALIVMGVNDGIARSAHRVVSSASSTVHCLAPIAKILQEAFAIRRAIFTTVHSYTSQHRLADVPSQEKRRGRAAAENIIPQESRSPRMVVEAIPELAGKLTGYAMNVPVVVLQHPTAGAALSSTRMTRSFRRTSRRVRTRPSSIRSQR